MLDEEIRYRGKVFTGQEIDDVRGVISLYPDKSRYFISREFCRIWNWTQPNGTPKDAVCRSLLLKLHREGCITLPPQKPMPARREGRADNIEVDQSPLTGILNEFLPIAILMVRRTPMEKIYRGLIHGHHYLGYARPVGEHLEYVAFIGERPVACMGWMSAPRHIGVRDRYLGWNKEERTVNLQKIAVNTRFLVLPWVRLPHLASHLLGRMAKRISYDWETIYRHEIVWIETFVDPERGFKGTCYKAANWRYLGLTTGRGKMI